jgi:hypothetical protein
MLVIPHDEKDVTVFVGRPHGGISEFHLWISQVCIDRGIEEKREVFFEMMKLAFEHRGRSALLDVVVRNDAPVIPRKTLMMQASVEELELNPEDLAAEIGQVFWRELEEEVRREKGLPPYQVDVVVSSFFVRAIEKKVSGRLRKALAKFDGQPLTSEVRTQIREVSLAVVEEFVAELQAGFDEVAEEPS